MILGRQRMRQVRLLNVVKEKYGKKKLNHLMKQLKQIIVKKMSRDYTDGFQDKVGKVNLKVGLIVTLVEQIQTVKKLVNLVVEVMVKIGQNIRRVDQPHQLAELRVKVKNGVKKLKWV